MGGRRPSAHGLARGKATKQHHGGGGKAARPSKRRAEPDSDPDSDSETEPQRKKKKKKKNKAEAEPPGKLRLLPPRQWTPAQLPPFVRIVRQPDAGGAAAAAEAEAARQRLHLRVPTQRRKVCSFWAKGECKRGAACAFLHASADAAAASAPPACPPPVSSLGDPSLPKLVGRGMVSLGHREASPVQAQVWPVALAGLDLLCRAPTGSGETSCVWRGGGGERKSPRHVHTPARVGKTLAYLLPAFAHAAAQSRPTRPGEGPRALVLVPTRELAVQTLSVARSLQRVSGGLRAAAVYGGGPREEQVSELEGSSLALLVATCGRLLDMLEAQVARS